MWQHTCHIPFILCLTNQCQIIVVFIYQWKTQLHTVNPNQRFFMPMSHSHSGHQVSAVLSWPCSLLECSADLKRQVGWPGNESCLYEACEHKEWLSGSGRWPSLGQLSGLSTKHNLSFGRIPTLVRPAISALTETGDVGKAPMNARMNVKIDYVDENHTEGFRSFTESKLLSSQITIHHQEKKTPKQNNCSIEARLEIKIKSFR